MYPTSKWDIGAHVCLYPFQNISPNLTMPKKVHIHEEIKVVKKLLTVLCNESKEMSRPIQKEIINLPDTPLIIIFFINR